MNLLIKLLLIVKIVTLYGLHIEEKYLISYMDHLIEKSFKPENLIGLSVIPSDTKCGNIANGILHNINRKTMWQVLAINEAVFDELLSQIKLHGHIFILCSHEEHTLKMLEDLVKTAYSLRYWDHATKSIILVPGTLNLTTSVVIKDIHDVIWYVTNVVVVVFAEKRSSNSLETQKLLSVYTWFPYQGNNCKFARDMALLEEHNFENILDFVEIQYFPPKILHDFHGCEMRVISVGIVPYRISTISMDKNGYIIYEDNSLPAKLLKLFAYEYNITVVLVEPIQGLDLGVIFDTEKRLDVGELDFITGSLAVSSFCVALMDMSVEFMYEHIDIIVPCPRRIPREKRVFSIFSLIVWCLIIIVFMLSSWILWILSIRSKKFHSFGKLSQSFINAWAVLIGGSVSELPTFSSFRYFFIQYLFFSLAMSTVFQTFFITFLIEPGYERGIETENDIRASGLPLGIPDMFIHVLESLGFTFHLKFDLVDCTDTIRCAERTISEGDIATAIGVNMANYVALTKGVQNIKKQVCWLGDIQGTLQIAFGLRKSNPLLPKLNNFIRRNVEGGMVKELLSLEEHELKLKSSRKDEGNDEYFVFSLHHLAPAFVMLILVHMTSAIVLVLEIVYCKCGKLLKKLRIAQK